MKKTEVLLREDVYDLGRTGDVVRVAAGYARNCLLPRKLALPATAENRRAMERRRSKVVAEEAALAADTQARVEVLSAVVVRTTQAADESGRLFGSVNAAAIAALLASAGHPVEERHVRLDSPIKTIGTHAIPVHVRGEATALVTLEVTAAEASA